MSSDVSTVYHDAMWFFWLIVALVCIALEFHSAAFVAVFMAVSSIVTLILSILGVPMWAQFLVWVVLSAVLVLTLRPYALRRFRHGHHAHELVEPTRSTMTGRVGVVEVEVGDASEPGRVKVEGESWKAVTTAAHSLKAGTRIVVDKVQSTTLWVLPENHADTHEDHED